MQMTKTNLKNFREDFNKAMLELEEKYGVSVNMKNISYDANMFKFSTEVMNVDEDAKENKLMCSHDAFNEFVQRRGYLNLIGKLGETVRMQGENFVIVGFKPRASKNAFIIRNEKSQEYVTSYLALSRNLATNNSLMF